jgi:hypothetical protein
MEFTPSDRDRRYTEYIRVIDNTLTANDMVSETPRIYAMGLKGFSEFLRRLLQTEPIPNLLGLPPLKG